MDSQRQYSAGPTGLIPQPVSIGDASVLVDRYEGDVRDMELALLIDRVVYPQMLNEFAKRQRSTHGHSGYGA